MRLSSAARAAIVGAARLYDPAARLWLFGSRADDAKRGGDIDIAILSRSIGRLGAFLQARDGDGGTAR